MLPTSARVDAYRILAIGRLWQNWCGFREAGDADNYGFSCTLETTSRKKIFASFLSDLLPAFFQSRTSAHDSASLVRTLAFVLLRKLASAVFDIRCASENPVFKRVSTHAMTGL